MRGLLLRALGLRVIEGPEALRITVPRWWGRFGTSVLDRTAERLSADSPDCTVRRYRRSLIARL